MPTVNREHGELLLPDGMVLEVTVGDPPAQGGVRYDGAAFRMRDAGGVFDPRTGAAPVIDLAWRRHFMLMGA